VMALWCRVALGVCWTMQAVRAALPLACLLLLRVLRCWMSLAAQRAGIVFV
jgi:hypothetical protein